MGIKTKIISFILTLSMAVGSLAVPLPTQAAKSNEDKAFEYLVNTAGFNRAAACGIMAVISAKSDFKPTQKTNGYGLMGWSDSRKSSLKKYTSNYKTLKGQLKFVKHEMKESYTKTYDYLQSISNTGTGAYNAGYQVAYGYAEMSLSEAVSCASVAMNTYWNNYENYKLSSSSSKKSSSSSSKKSSSKKSSTTTYYVSGCSYLNYRTSPSKKSNSNIAGQYKKGTKVKCDSSYSKKVGSTTWFRFKKSGKWYYISSKYLSKKKPSSSSSSSNKSSSSSSEKSSSKKSSTTTYYVSGCSYLNYRTSPSKKSDSNIAGQYKKGTKVKCDSSYSKKVGSTTWKRFKKNGKWYYASSKYLSKTKPKSSSSSSSKKKDSGSSKKSSSSGSGGSSKTTKSKYETKQKAKSSGYTTASYEVTASTLNQRYGPGTNYKAYPNQLTKGTVINATTTLYKGEDGSSWRRYAKNGYWRYVSSKYLKRVSGSTSSKSSSSSSNTETRHVIKPITAKYPYSTAAGGPKCGTVSGGSLITVDKSFSSSKYYKFTTSYISGWRYIKRIYVV